MVYILNRTLHFCTSAGLHPFMRGAQAGGCVTITT